jgi:Caspase domain
MGLLPLPAGQLLVATADPCLSVLEPDGSARWTHPSPDADLRDQRESFAVSADGTVIDFGFRVFDKSLLRFDLRALQLSANPPADDVARPPKQDGLPIEDWYDSYHPKLNGKPIGLQEWELSRSLAIHPDGHRFVLGSSFSLRAFDAEGKALWNRATPAEVLAVNITGDGRLVVAAYLDGTIRWYRMDQGRELLALYGLGDKKNWVAWTPEGFYAATSGAFGVLRWQVNKGVSAAAETVPVSAIPRLYRPDALPLVLQELETERALGIAEAAAARREVQLVTGAAKPPGARLHVLAIGISDYGDKAEFLRLKFADKDAKDVADALFKTQRSEYNKLGGLYAEVLAQYLHDSTADRAGIFNAFDAMQRDMANDSAGQDLAVVMFSGHGAVVDKRFYLLPYGVNAGTTAELKGTAISADDFQAEVAKLALHGRVLLLLDACQSGAVTADGSKLTPNADLLHSEMSTSNVTVLTSSSENEVSREDDKLGHGAFTKVLMQALSGDADEDHRGVISMSELTDYMYSHLPLLTNGQQHPEVEQRFQSDLFVAGL